MVNRHREIFLLPGGLAYGGSQLRFRTLLGSCVSVVVWHPRLLVGGMCHFLLPSRYPAQDDMPLDGRYGHDALHMLMLQMTLAVTDPTEFQVHIAGGANCFSGIAARSAQPLDIGRRNIEAAQDWVTQHRLCVQQTHVGGEGYRHVGFDNHNGRLSIRDGTQAEAQQSGVSV